MTTHKEELLELIERRDIEAICELVGCASPYQLDGARAGDVLCILFPTDEQDRITAPLFFLVMTMEKTHQKGRHWYVKALNDVAEFPKGEISELVTQDHCQNLRADHALSEDAWALFATAAIMNVGADRLTETPPEDETLDTSLELI